MRYLLSCKNSNIAIKIFDVLSKNGIKSHIAPTPSSLNEGCGLSLIIDSDNALKMMNGYCDKFIAYQITKNSKKNVVYKKIKVKSAIK